MPLFGCSRRSLRRWSGHLLFWCVACAANWLQADDAAAPRVLGLERLASAGSLNSAAAGQILLGELNCTSCHLASDALAAAIQRKPAPVLDRVGSRVKPEYLTKFLADPQAVKPGTTMPHVLAGLPEGERAVVVESLVHFLATTGTLEHGNPSRHAVNRGEALFHSVGCLACHDPRREPAHSSFPTSIPLGTPSQKYTLPGLTQFLADPLAVRGGGRMPHLLSPGEARDVASFLLNDLDIVLGLQYAYYEGDFAKLPDFQKLTPTAVGEAESFDLGVARRRDHFALRLEGTIQLPLDGEYLFLIGSDDGSRLLIDGKAVVVNDDVHSFQQKRKKLKMKKGPHAVAVEYFESAGDETLQVDFEGPGMQQQPLATILTGPKVDQPARPAGHDFVVDAAKAARGREHFAKLGCAACHTLKEGGAAIGALNRAPLVADLRSERGCLAEGDRKTPRYGLNAAQRAALKAGLGSLKTAGHESATIDPVKQSLVRFNCIACHERAGLGGVEDARNAFFQTDMPEMGDEGRLPPSLSGVGAKLTGTWLKRLFEQGADDRPYMLTRMPKFGLANVGGLVHGLAQADASLVQAAPSLMVSGDGARRVKAGGRRLVGSQGFSCIKCHTFAGQRSSGIQALSLTTMTQRLKPEWFYHYLQQPLAYRPGTRMPTPFPDGQTTLPAVLDGTVSGQIAAIWSYLADGDKALYPVGLVTGKIELMALDEAVIFRNFIEGAGTRAIGVGYAEKLNLAFDAEHMRLALLWHGAFIDAARHWTARGAGFEKPLGDNVLTLPDGLPLAELDGQQAAWPAQEAAPDFHFRGYRLDEKQRPTFLYSWKNLSVEDSPRPVGEQDLFVMQRTLHMRGDAGAAKVWLRAAVGDTIQKAAPGAFRIDDKWTLYVKCGGEALVRSSAGEFELLVPVLLHEGRAMVELTYDW